MKKILTILTFSLLASNNLFANDNKKIQLFNEWLYKNNYHQYLKLEQRAACKTEPKYSNHWYGNDCDKFQGSNNLNIKLNKKKIILVMSRTLIEVL